MKNKKETIAFTLGRFSPPHLAHICFMLWALNDYDRLIIGIASCYEVGLPRHPLLAFIREKMIALSLIAHGVDMSRVTFVHLQDFNDWEKWWRHITSFPGAEKITHFITGNREEILDEIKRRGMKLPFKIVNPEKVHLGQYNFPYHASDLREAIIQNEYEKFDQIAAFGTKILMANAGGFAGMRQALENRAVKFRAGRQTIDLVLICGEGKKRFVLCGKRLMSKTDFPGVLALPGGEIEVYENPIDAVVRELEEETGLQAEITSRYLEPAHIKICGLITELKFVGLFSTNDNKLCGSQGGSSQVFGISLEISPNKLRKYLANNSDLENVDLREINAVLKEGLAFQQNKMLKQALSK